MNLLKDTNFLLSHNFYGFLKKLISPFDHTLYGESFGKKSCEKQNE